MREKINQAAKGIFKYSISPLYAVLSARTAIFWNLRKTFFRAMSTKSDISFMGKHCCRETQSRGAFLLFPSAVQKGCHFLHL